MNVAPEALRPAVPEPAPDWTECNRQWLDAAFDRLRTRFEAAARDGKAAPHERPGGGKATPGEMRPALLHCRELFDLSPFETEILLALAGIELDRGLRAATARLHPDGRAALTFEMALALLAEPHRDAISPDAALRYWRMVDPQDAALDGLHRATLLLDERVLHFLLGIGAQDARLSGAVQPIAPRPLADRGDTMALACRIAGQLVPGPGPAPVVTVDAPGQDREALRDFALGLLDQSGRDGLWIAAGAVPADVAEREELARRIDREAGLTGRLPVLALSGPGEEGDALALAARMQGPLLWLGTSGHGLAALPRPRRTLHYALPAPGENATTAMLLARARDLARDPATGPDVAEKAPEAAPDCELEAAIARAGRQFRLGPGAIDTVIAQVASSPPEARAAEVWPAARAAARGGLDALAQRIETRVTFDDLVLPGGQIAVLHEILQQLVHRDVVYRDWGFGALHGRGQGLVALFAGESGTGKTLAAEALANAAGLDLYRIDLANVVSKYIGETEKNLGQVFEAADRSGAVLQFDEADALFGKRSEVKDSHDRYANIEVAYLLQRVEAYRGLAILTTNLRSALDRAFLRRIRFVVSFPFPDAPARERIWRGQFPPSAPLDAVDFGALASLNLHGGSIRNIAVNAAFKAAAAGGAIDQDLLMAASREEFARLERPAHGLAGPAGRAAP